MVAPLIIAGGLAAGQALSKEIGKKSVPGYNPGFAYQQAQEGGITERQGIDDFMAGTKANEGTFRNDVATAGNAAKTESQSAAQDYLNNFDPITSRIVQNRTDSLKRSTLGAIPELVQAGREAGAASGGLDRGVIQDQLAGIATSQGKQFSEGAANIENTAMQNQLDARSKVFDSSNQLILQKLGIDSNSAQAILNSGNQALIQQLNDLIDESRNRIGINLSADTAAQGSAAGAITNANSNRTAIMNGLINAGGTIAGGLLSGNGNTSAPASRNITAAGTNASDLYDTRRA